MATLTAIKFNTPTGADEMLNLLGDLQRQNLITILDGATVTWPQGKKGPKTRQLTNLAGRGALDGAFWGMLFGLLFFVPFLGMAVGAAMGALTGSMADIGINDDFIKQVRSKVTEGTSAIFLLTGNVVVDRVLDSVRQKGLQPELIASNLSSEQEAKLNEAFASF
jgi:uncharacterized membrane protein